ncbi:hypothetical protein JOC77_000921 [Peribacillus deserti]|uniref:Spore coat protein n=1 Tax=Peribacillus deserti TaxID=673318 RepID=A0ABS2QEE1_9BACI|nr:hypothetical protein [Peribacillus deserti]MBM7691516.1 hypothetical protein [Peribacillus deserti]
MSKKKSKHENATAQLMGMLVSNTLKKHGIETNAMNLSDKEKHELRKTVKKLKKQADTFLKNLHKNVTEAEAGVVSTNSSPETTSKSKPENTTENDLSSLKVFNKDK